MVVVPPVTCHNPSLTADTTALAWPMVEYMSALTVVKVLCLSPVVVPNKRGIGCPNVQDTLAQQCLESCPVESATDHVLHNLCTLHRV